MRVTQLGVQVEREIFMKGKLFVTHTDVLVPTFLDNSASIHRLNNSIDSVVKVLNHHGVSLLNGKLNSLYQFGVGETSDLEVGVLHTFLKPGNSLQLRIDDEGVTLRVSEDSSVFYRDLIGWKLVVVPSSDLSRRS
jgi:hypothetical protein